MTANIVCNLSLESDKYRSFEYQPHVKGNFSFIDSIYHSFGRFQAEEEQNYNTVPKNELSLEVAKPHSSMIGKDHSLYHSLMKTSIGVQMFVRQSNHLYETHFVHCEEINHLFEQRMEF